MALTLNRHEANPLLIADANREWDGGLVFNGAVTRTDDGVLHMLFRAVRKGFSRIAGDRGANDAFENFVSSIGHATSVDGIGFSRDSDPVLAPSEPYDIWGVEDPRITRVGDTFYVLYTGLSEPAYTGSDHVRVCLATTNDFVNFIKHGVIGPNYDSKAGFLMPRQIQNNWKLCYSDHGALNTPNSYVCSVGEYYEGSSPTISRVATDRVGEMILLDSQRRLPDGSMPAGGYEIGPGLLETPHGWLNVHSRLQQNPDAWTIGVSLHDLESPSILTHEIPYDILKPETDIEINGCVERVVFPQGQDVVDDEYRLYYGAGDQAVCLATCNFSELLNELLRHPV